MLPRVPPTPGSLTQARCSVGGPWPSEAAVAVTEEVCLLSTVPSRLWLVANAKEETAVLSPDAAARHKVRPPAGQQGAGRTARLASWVIPSRWPQGPAQR